ncbi:MAG: Lrp/AsnC family transcriptional regulator [Armatimonadetes bacterium]|nr:Lrp/AsnC family transcriptional regulator [Armatimonadota bacterium]
MHAILDILESDARTPPSLIAERLGMPEEAVRKQIADWERTGVIRRYKTIVDREALGDDRVVAYIDVAVTPERGAGFDAVASRIARFPEVTSVALVSGGHDLRVVVEGASIRAVSAFVAERLATLDRVTGTNTHFELKRYKHDGDLLIESEADQRLVVTP